MTVLALILCTQTYPGALREIGAGRLDQALVSLQSLSRCRPSARVMSKLLDVYDRSGRLDRAPAFLDVLLAENPRSPHAHFAMTLLRKRQKDYDRAAAHAWQAIGLDPAYFAAYAELAALARLRGGTDETAAALEGRGGAAHYGLGLFALHKSDWNAALEHLRQAPESWEVSDALFQVFYRTDRYDEALQVLERMVSAAGREPDLERLARALGRQGMIHSDRGDYVRALQDLERAVALSVEAGERSSEQTFRASLGLVHVYLGRYPRALEECNQALRISREIGNRLSEGRNLGLIAGIHNEMAEYDQALEHYTQAIAIAQAARDRPSEADQRASVAQVWLALGDPASALDSVRQALAIAQDLDNPWLEGRSYEILALTKSRMGHHREALAAYEKGLAAARKVGDKLGEATRLGQMAEVRERLGETISSLELYRQALAAAEDMGAALVEGRIRNSLGNLYLRQHDWARGREAFERALALGEQTRMPEVIWRACAGLADLDRELNRTRQAAEWFRRAVDAVEQVRTNLPMAEDRSGFLEDKIALYQRFVAFLASRGRAAEAFHYAERASARAFLDLVAESGNARSNDPTLAARYREAETRLSSLHARMARQPARSAQLTRDLIAAEREFQDVRRAIRRTQPRAAESRLFTVPETQRLLEPGTTLLKYSLGREVSYGFAVTRTSFSFFRLPPAAVLAREVGRLRAAVERPARESQGDFLVAARALYRNLIEPAAPHLRSARELVVVPDGTLQSLPFELLIHPGGESDDLAQQPYLVRGVRVRYAPSVSVLAALNVRTAAAAAPRKALLAFADPIYENGFARLARSGTEAAAIAKLFPAGETTVLERAAASEDAAKNPSLLRQYEVIHFAAHGVLNAEQPSFSGLALGKSPGSAEDGVLRAHEILNLKLNARLVVLSACETGLGKNVRGEGLVGLARALHQAGAAAVVASLWKVEDSATAELMVHFYRRMREQRLEPSDALRKAKLDLMAGPFAHPYYWAPFVLSGAAERR